MKRVIDTQELARLEQLRAHGARLVEELTKLEQQAAALLRVSPHDEHSNDLLVECVWSNATVQDTLKLLGVRVRA